MTPLPGMFATIRSRLGVIVSVSPADARDGSGRTHLVQVEFKDDLEPKSERLVWELEPHAACQHPNRLPDPAQGPMDPLDFDAVLRAARWTATMPYLDPDQEGPLDRMPVCSPLLGAVKVEDFQLVPLHKALAMPRVALLLADDVGLGKTIEAGLIISELISRRRISRVLVLTPASLRDQWQEEMEEKFSLRFEVVDRENTQKLRKEVGIDANPWRMHDRVITSYHYLKQPDVLEQFMSASRVPEGSPRLPWDLVVVDECHNAMPSPFGEDSGLCEAIQAVLPLCEHRLFLSATPHNGHTRSFTGILEMLDPVRFTRSSELTHSAKERVKQVMVRRLKRHIDESSPVRRFCQRKPPAALDLRFSKSEAALFRAFEQFRDAVREAVAKESRSRQLAGAFAVEILGKRLISSPVAFADSWWRSRDSFEAEESATDQDLEKAHDASAEEIDSDAETEAREAVASKVVGAWLLNLKEHVGSEIASVDAALEPLGLGREARPAIAIDPKEDRKIDETIALIERLTRRGKHWSEDERLIIFTEFKTTLDYLLRRLREHFREDARFLSLFGGMNDDERRAVKDAFNRTDSEVRVLVATDAASEGLNLQQTARYMLHFDCPWNPMRLEQRIGRLDRHGQGRDVEVFHFTSEQSADLRFLSKVIQKVDQVREDLGSCGEVFDAGLKRRLILGEDADGLASLLDVQVDEARKLCQVEADDSSSVEDDPLGPLTAAIDLTPAAMRDTLDTSLAWGGLGRPQLEPVVRPGGAPGAWRLKREDFPGWKDTIDNSVRVRSESRALGAMRDIAFGADSFLVPVGDLKVFKCRPDTVFVHLAHPLMRQGLQRLVRTRYPGQESISRWTVRRSEVPRDLDAIILLSIEELAVNNLRETFHHWVRTVAFPVKAGKLGAPIENRPAAEWSAGCQSPEGNDAAKAEDLMADNLKNLEKWITSHRAKLQANLESQLSLDQQAARDDAAKAFQSRAGELSDLIQKQSIQRIELEIEAMRNEKASPFLFENLNKTIEHRIEQKQEELERRKRQLEEVRAALDSERERVISRVIPKRYALGSDVAVFPVTVEVRLPLKGAGK
jgi:superfamily II DNA or RNA helicase